MSPQSTVRHFLDADLGNLVGTTTDEEKCHVIKGTEISHDWVKMLEDFFFCFKQNLQDIFWIFI